MLSSCVSLKSTWTAHQSIDIRAQAQDVFTLLCDVPSWPSWDEGLTAAYLQDPSSLEIGSTGTLVMRNYGSFQFTITKLDPSGYFSYETKLTGVTAVWYWKFDCSSAQSLKTGTLELEIGVIFTGYLAPWYKFWFEKDCNEGFEKACVNMKNLLEGPMIDLMKIKKSLL
jgi:hypothetical protein